MHIPACLGFLAMLVPTGEGIRGEAHVFSSLLFHPGQSRARVALPVLAVSSWKGP